MLKVLSILLLCGVVPFQQAAVQEGSLLTAVINIKDLEGSLLQILHKDGLIGKLLGGLLSGGSQGSSTGGNPDKQGGLLKGLLGRRRRDLLGGALGGNNGLLGGALGGNNGLLGGVLGGKNGLLGLGGKDGLLGLGGKDGLLGLGDKNGLLGSILNLLNLRIANATLLDLKLETLPGGGLGLKIGVILDVLGNSGAAPGKARPSGALTDLRILVEVNIKAALRMVQDESGAAKFMVENCLTDLAHIELLSGTLLQNVGDLLSNTLNGLLPPLLCPVVDLVLKVLNGPLDSLSNMLPMGNMGFMQYILAKPPLIEGENLLLNLNLNLGGNNGNPINQVPAELASLPPLTDHTSKLLLSPNVLSRWLELLVKGGQFNADITQEMLSGAVPMTTSELESILHLVSGLLPANASLVVKIQISDPPGVSLQNGNFTMALKAAIEVLAKNSSALTQLLVLEADMKLAGPPIISGTKMHLLLDLESVELKLVSSEIGDMDVGSLHNWSQDILQDGYMPVVNGTMDTAALPLPYILNLGYLYGQANILENTIVAPLAPKLP